MTRFSMYFQGACLLARSTGFWTNVTSQQANRATASSLESSQHQLTHDSSLPLLIIDAQQSDMTVRPVRPIPRPRQSVPGQGIVSPGEGSNVQPPDSFPQMISTPKVVRSVRVSPTGQVIASGDDEDEMQVWDLATGEQLHTWLDGRSQRMQAVDFTPDGQTLIGGGVVEGRLRRWGWQEDLRLVKASPLDNTYSVELSPDGAFIATGHSGGVINLWTQDLELIRSIQAYEPSVNVVAVAFAPNGAILASRGFGGVGTDVSLKLLDVSTGKITDTFSGDSSGGGDSIAYSPDGNILAGYYSGTYEAGTVRLWHPGTGEVITDLSTAVVRPHAITFSSDGQFMAVAGLSVLIEVWDVQNREVVQTFTSGLGFHHVYINRLCA